jgi:hypothetical protein
MGTTLAASALCLLGMYCFMAAIAQVDKVPFRAGLLKVALGAGLMVIGGVGVATSLHFMVIA